MPSFIKDIARKIDDNLILSCFVLVAAETLSIIYTLPLAWLCYLLSGYIFWKVNNKDIIKYLLLFLSAPMALQAVNESILAIGFISTIMLLAISIVTLKKTNSWSFLIESNLIIILLLYLLLQVFFPDITEPFKAYIAKINNIDVAKVDFPLGLLITSVVVEVMLFTWMSCRFFLKTNPVAEAIVSSASEVRIGYVVLGLTIVLPIFAYLLSYDLLSLAYILGMPYVIAGISLLSWIYKNYKNSKKTSNTNFIWLIFMFLYATLLPLALGFLGLIDVGLNLREKYQNYLKRR